MGDHQRGDCGTACPKTKLCQAYNITVIILKQQKQCDFGLCELPSHSSCLAGNTSCNSVPAPVSLPPLYPDQEHFLISGQGLASGQLLVVPDDAKALRQELIREVNCLIFTGDLKNDMKLNYLCFLKIFCHPDVVLLFCYTVLKVCFSARLAQLS